MKYIKMEKKNSYKVKIEKTELTKSKNRIKENWEIENLSPYILY